MASRTRDTTANNVTDLAKGPIEFASLNDFFTGNAEAFNGAGFATGNWQRHMSYQGYAAFIQDDWRLTPRLTVNLGLRYELDTVQRKQ